jgi:hypothetical protein
VRFAEEIIARREHVAKLAALLGRARQELRADIRSIAFKNYVIFSDIFLPTVIGRSSK